MARPSHAWVFPARVLRVIDGDTLDVFIDGGFHGFRTERLRLLGLDAPERERPTREAGEDSRSAVIRWITERAPAGANWPFVVETVKGTDSFGRYLARLWAADDPDAASLNEWLVSAGFAVVRA